MSKTEIQYLKDIKFKEKLKQYTEQYANKRILLYGAGLLLSEAIKRYDFSELNIVAVSDKKFETEFENTWLKYNVVLPSDIEKLNPDVIMLTVKDYKKIYIPFITKYKNIKIVPMFYNENVSAFERRNLNHNVFVECKGLHGKKDKKYPKFIIDFIKFKNKLNYKLGNIDIPQIEFNLTTVCTLRCEYCSNFIPYLKPNEHSKIKFEDFKIQLSNLTKSVRKIKNLILLGGEPLTVPNLHEYVEFASKNNKIEKVWIVTNGTLLMNDNLKKTLAKYKKKIIVWVSNYSKNEKLKSKLKHSELLTQIKELDLDYDYVKDLNWSYTSKITTKPLREDSEFYFECCGNNCVSVFEGKIYVCPRAGVFDKKNIYVPQDNEIIDLNVENNPKLLKQKLKDFYSRKSFTACNYCTIVEDRMHEKVIPAIQLESN